METTHTTAANEFTHTTSDYCGCQVCGEERGEAYDAWLNTPEGEAAKAEANVEAYAEFGMGYVTSGGYASDVSGAWTLHTTAID